MTPDEMLKLADEAERLAGRCPEGPYEVWDGCSWRRIGIQGTTTTVCEPTKHPRDGVPDLIAKTGVLDLFAISRTLVPQLAGALRDVVKENLELSDRLRRALCRVMEMDVQAQSGVFDIDLREWWEANKTEEDESHLRMVAALKGR